MNSASTAKRLAARLAEQSGPDSARAVPPEHRQPPRHFGKYRVVERLGVGAFGVVYRCHDPDLDRCVAVKVLTSEDYTEPDTAERFQREARAAARLSHPHVVQVFDAGVDGSRPYLVMEYVEGLSLDRLVGSPRLTVETTLRVVYHLARALQAAHEQGIVHRDVKPGNILVDRSGRPKLADFGMARIAADAGRLSRTGDLLGTPRYMSPEQALLPADEIDHRTDIYSLGVVAYELLTGLPAADGPNPIAVLRRVTDEEPVPIRQRNPDVPEEVAEICRRMMSKDRELRYASAGAVADAIQAFIVRRMFGNPEVELLAALPPLAAPHSRTRRWRVLTGAAALLAFGLVAGAVLWRWAAAGRGGPTNPEPPPAAIDVAAVVRSAGAAIDELTGVGDPAMHRTKLLAAIEDLSAVLKAFPDDSAARLLRARAYRRAGEFASALADLNALPAASQTLPTVLAERCLARYVPSIVYLGSLQEPVLRPRPPADLAADFERLADGRDKALTRIGRIASAVARGELTAAAREAETRAAGPAAATRMGDLALIEADALLRAAEHAEKDESEAADDAAKQAAGARQEALAARGVRVLQGGLAADPNHVGLLFLKADTFQRLAAWEGDDLESFDQRMRRSRPAFETALVRFRAAAPQTGRESAIARAVLLANFGRPQLAVEQVNDAITHLPADPSLYAFRAWLEIHNPADGVLSAEEVARIAKGLEPVFDLGPESPAADFVRAVLAAVAGRADDARRDLRQCRRLLGGAPLPSREAVFRNWYDAAEANYARFLDETISVFSQFSTPVELRVQLSETLIGRLADPARVRDDGLQPDEAAELRLEALFRLAKFYAEKDDKPAVLRTARAALSVRRAGVTPSRFRDDDSFKGWNGDEEFVKLYKEFEPPAPEPKRDGPTR